MSASDRPTPHTNIDRHPGVACERASAAELRTLLHATGAPDALAFRNHYPGCPTCARAVALWTADRGMPLDGNLTPHPTPKKLLWFGERPQSLASDERRGIEAHVAACRACRDELTSLRRLDLHALTRPLASIDTTISTPLPLPPRSGWASHPTARVASLAVALGLAGALVARFQSPPGAPPPNPPTERPPAGAAQSQSARLEEAAARAVGAAVTPAPPPRPVAARPASPAPKPAPAAAEVVRRPSSPSPAIEPAAPVVTAPAPRFAAVPLEARAEADDNRTAGLPPAIARDRRGPDPEPGPSDLPSEARATAVQLRPAGVARITAAATDGFVLLAPSRAATAPTAAADIHIVDVSQRRELRQRGSVQDGNVSTHVAGAWLTPGNYQVEVSVGGVLTVYRLAVTR